ncbi:MAG TPA: ribonuclease HI family protein [Candidatus Saccharimonadales bacterium]|jgi:ribonuclease HI|nr:ribonuclease HI family protein [Candidatus Saccharimonadales bacterium]
MSPLINAVSPQAELLIHTDGGSRGNPGPSAIGVVITTPNGKHVESFGKYLGITTNNQAEYSAVVAAIKAAEKYQPQKLDFILDSELVVKQLNGVYRVKHGELRVLYDEVQKLIGGMQVSFSHVLRSQNQLADIEVNKALDQAEGSLS